MSIWIDENQEGFVSKGYDTYYFHLNEIYRDAYCGNVKYRTMTYKQFKKLYPVSTYNWAARKKKK
jgi:hypothetical protein